MTEEERELVHKQHAGRVPAEPATPEGRLMVGLTGFRSTDHVQIVATAFYADADGNRQPAVVEWELDETNTEITFSVYGADGKLLTEPDQFITIDWMATTR